MNKKTKTKISISQKRYYKTKKRNFKLRKAGAKILLLAGLLIASYSGLIHIQTNIALDNITSVDAITEEQAKEVYGIKINGVEATASVTVITKGEAALSASKPEVKTSKQKIKEWVLNEVEKAGLCPKEVDCLIFNESRWNDFAYNINKNGTIDCGLWQINQFWHKNTISFKNSLDYKKATEWSINKRLRDGNWNAWYGFAKCL